jgi:hypothetical protein
MERGGVADADHEGDAVGMSRTRGGNRSSEGIGEKVLARFRLDRHIAAGMGRFQFWVIESRLVGKDFPLAILAIEV